MKKRKMPLSRVYTLIEPGPVVLLATADKGGRNVMPLSWLMMMEFEPPLIGCIVSARNFSFTALRKTKQCTLNIPDLALLDTLVACGNVSGRHKDKFASFGLTPHPASEVAVPLIAECFANLECRVVDTRWLNRYNFFVLEVVAAWVVPGLKAARTLHHRGYGRFMVAGEEARLPSKMR